MLIFKSKYWDYSISFVKVADTPIKDNFRKIKQSLEQGIFKKTMRDKERSIANEKNKYVFDRL